MLHTIIPSITKNKGGLSILMLFAITTLLSHQSWAQKDPSNLTQKVVTIGSRELTLEDVTKPVFLPEEIDTVMEKTDVKYTTEPVYHKTSYEPDTIQAAKLKIVEPLNKLQRFHAKAGIGIYTTTLVDVYYNSLRNKNGQVGFAFNHLASAGGVKNTVSNGKYSNNKVDIWGKRFNRKSILGAEVKYNTSRRHFYGLDTAQHDFDMIPKDSISLRFSTVGGGVSLNNENHKRRDFDYDSKLNFYHSFTSNDVSQNQFVFNTDLAKKINKETYQVNVLVDHNQWKGSDTSLVDKQNSTLVTLNPKVRTFTGKLDVQVGLKIASEFREGKSYFSFFPDLSLSYKVAEKFVVPYAGLTGQLQRNNLNTFYKENPFINPNLELQTTKEQLHAFLGVRGNASNRTSYNLKGDYSLLKSMPFFVSNELNRTSTEGYEVIYDDAKRLKVQAEVSYHLAQRWKVITKLTYQDVKTDSLEFAYNVAPFTANAILIYNLKNKLIFNADIMFVGKRNDRGMITGTPTTNGSIDYTFENPTLKAYTDISLGAEYRYTKRISAFVELTNILSQDYEIYHNYRSQKFGAIGGFSYSF